MDTADPGGEYKCKMRFHHHCLRTTDGSRASISFLEYQKRNTHPRVPLKRSSSVIIINDDNRMEEDFICPICKNSLVDENGMIDIGELFIHDECYEWQCNFCEICMESPCEC